MMHLPQSLPFPYATGDGWQAVELPYLHDELALLLIVMPDDSRFSQVNTMLQKGLLDDVVAALKSELMPA
jgi:serine protease inhibitor